MFSAELKNPALKFLKSLKDKTTLKRISNKIDELEKNPFPQDIERVEGYKDVKIFRVRVGDYRIIYTMITDGILILRIAHRKEVYRGD